MRGFSRRSGVEPCPARKPRSRQSRPGAENQRIFRSRSCIAQIAALVAMRFKHLGVAADDITKAVEFYTDLFGYQILAGPVEDPLQKVWVCFVGTGKAGDLTIEIVAPSEDRSPVNQVLRKGIGAYHVCYEVDNIEKALEQARAKGCIVLTHPLPAVAFEGRRIAWFYTPTRQLVELLEE